MTQEEKLPTASRGWTAPRPARHPLEPTSFITKKTLEGPPGGGRSKPTQPDTQSVRIEQSDDTQGFFGSTTPPRSIERCCKTPWTPTHVDHRIISPNHHVPNLSHYIKDKVGPMEEDDPRQIIPPFHPIHSCPAPRVGGPRGRGTKSSSTASRRLPPLRRGEGSTDGEATLGLASS
jgi:hypothetical protein